MDGYTVKLDAETNLCCTIHLFTNVTNISEVKKKVISGELSCCVLKAVLIADPFQVIVAANKAAINAKLNQMTTKSVYTELLFCLSTSKNISRSLLEFGIDDRDKNILIVSIYDNDDESRPDFNIIKGEAVPISQLKLFTDIDLIKKTYKIDNDEIKNFNLVDSIVSRICIKDFASFK